MASSASASAMETTSAVDPDAADDLQIELLEKLTLGDQIPEVKDGLIADPEQEQTDRTLDNWDLEKNAPVDNDGDEDEGEEINAAAAVRSFSNVISPDSEENANINEHIAYLLKGTTALLPVNPNDIRLVFEKTSHLPKPSWGLIRDAYRLTHANALRDEIIAHICKYLSNVERHVVVNTATVLTTLTKAIASDLIDEYLKSVKHIEEIHIRRGITMTAIEYYYSQKSSQTPTLSNVMKIAMRRYLQQYKEQTLAKRRMKIKACKLTIDDLTAECINRSNGKWKAISILRMLREESVTPQCEPDTFAKIVAGEILGDGSDSVEVSALNDIIYKLLAAEIKRIASRMFAERIASVFYNDPKHCPDTLAKIRLAEVLRIYGDCDAVAETKDVTRLPLAILKAVNRNASLLGPDEYLAAFENLTPFNVIQWCVSITPVAAVSKDTDEIQLYGIDELPAVFEHIEGIFPIRRDIHEERLSEIIKGTATLEAESLIVSFPIRTPGMLYLMRAGEVLHTFTTSLQAIQEYRALLWIANGMCDELGSRFVPGNSKTPMYPKFANKFVRKEIQEISSLIDAAQTEFKKSIALNYPALRIHHAEMRFLHENEVCAEGVPPIEIKDMAASLEAIRRDKLRLCEAAVWESRVLEDIVNIRYECVRHTIQIINIYERAIGRIFCKTHDDDSSYAMYMSPMQHAREDRVNTIYPGLLAIAQQEWKTLHDIRVTGMYPHRLHMLPLCLSIIPDPSLFIMHSTWTTMTQLWNHYQMISQTVSDIDRRSGYLLKLRQTTITSEMEWILRQETTDLAADERRRQKAKEILDALHNANTGKPSTAQASTVEMTSSPQPSINAVEALAEENAQIKKQKDAQLASLRDTITQKSRRRAKKV